MSTSDYRNLQITDAKRARRRKIMADASNKTLISIPIMAAQMDAAALPDHDHHDYRRRLATDSTPEPTDDVAQASAWILH